MDDTRTRRSGGREGRKAMRAASHGPAEAFLTRTMKPFELVSEEGLELLEHNADTILEDGRRRDPRLPVGAGTVP